MNETLEMKTVSFKEVHEDLKKEGNFLLKKHDTSDFRQKSSFLSNTGFGNSIATRLYDSVASNSYQIKAMYEKYNSLYTFILEPQLERLCEKYNLFVRKLDYFIGDIPSKNVQDLMNFRLKFEDLPEVAKDCIIKTYIRDNINRYSEYVNKEYRYNSFRGNEDFIINNIYRNFEKLEGSIANHGMIIKEDRTYHKDKIIREYFTKGMGSEAAFVDNSIGLNDLGRLNNICEKPFIEIAAIKALFNEIAFQDIDATSTNKFVIDTHSSKRILQYDKPFIPEAPARSRVDLDPIVLINLDNCRLIVTAWGDEANDELVMNPKSN